MREAQRLGALDEWRVAVAVHGGGSYTTTSAMSASLYSSSGISMTAMRPSTVSSTSGAS